MRNWSWIALLLVGAAAPCAWADASYSTIIVQDAPIAYWRLGDASNSPVALDVSGYTPTGSTGYYTRGVTSGVPGAIVGDTDTAASFDGATAFVVIPNTTNGLFDLKSSFSLEAWVINAGQSGVGQAGRIFSNRGAQGFGLGILHTGAVDRVRFTTFGILDYDSDKTIVPEDSNWHHLVLVLDSTFAASFYLDGTLTDTILGTRAAGSSPSDLNIGRNPGTTAEYFNGSIDEAAIYNYELTPDQVTLHYVLGTK